MLVQHRNQANRECLYAWYPEAVCSSVTDIQAEARDIYIHTGIDRTLLVEPTRQGNRATSANGSSTNPSNQRLYHSNETVDEALRTPWALDFDIVRRTATPNPATQPIEAQQEAVPRRLKSAPVLRSQPPAAILTIPEPRLIVAAVPTVIVEPVPPRTRASSAKARLSTTLIEEKPPARRQIHSAQRAPRNDSTALSEEEIQQIFRRVYGNTVVTPPPAVQVVYTQPVETRSRSPPPIYVYQKSSSWTPDTVVVTNPVGAVEVSAVPLNPHYLHRPGVIAIRNQEKRSLIRGNSAPRRHQRKRTEPLRAFAPVAPKTKISLEIDGVKLTYDPKLTLDDRSSNLTKYFVDGRLYLIKNQRYNIIEHVDPASLLTAAQRSKNPQRYMNIHRMSLGKRSTNC